MRNKNIICIFIGNVTNGNVRKILNNFILDCRQLLGGSLQSTCIIN